MNTCCYTLVVRQIYCQNGNRRTINNVYTNIIDGSNIKLHYGYVLTIVQRDCYDSKFSISNEIYIPNTSFSVTNGEYKMLSLPAENGSFRIYVTFECTPCNTCCN